MGPDDFDYDLPASAIAQVPLADRSAARLLDATGPSVVHRTVRDLPSLLGPADILVLNNTRVLPARLRLRRPTGGAAEVLLLHPVDEHRAQQLDPQNPDDLRQDGHLWEALVRP
ncbi:MAG: S-adenosylmethionine:tRNA ribosyltransferase-isomerase, partial [Actinomycetia bacterium]|nr:S-adenosylmethionine:tRNA ribosyltransferase-isomerase [Actinomycetes bacterium]